MPQLKPIGLKRCSIMGTILLENENKEDTTIVSNYFIDSFMPDANGEFVKIYLYLLRCHNSGSEISICNIADVFHHTENDVSRALLYWEQTGLLSLTFNEENELCKITLTNCSALKEKPDTILTSKKRQETSGPKNHKEKAVQKKTELSHDIHTSSTASDKKNSPGSIQAIHTYTANELAQFTKDEDVCQLLYIAQRYIGQTLSSNDTNTILYMYDGLGFSTELIEYLIEYCVSNNHRSLRYMEKVAIAWKEKGISTVEEAKEESSMYSSHCYPVLKAFGISGRNPGQSERNFIVKWTTSYGFSLDIILEACNRTIETIHQPSFEYADSILSKWKTKGIRHLSQIQELDKQFAQTKEQKGKNTSSAVSSRNSFNSFSQRDYDYAELEKQLLKVD